MNPDANLIWRAPRWALAILLASLGMLGPFAIDTYLPAFAGIAESIDATPVQMQQTLSAYLFGFAAMNLFHGALSDSFGRRPVVLTGIAAFTLASVGCALSESIASLVLFRTLQGMSTGAGIVVSRAIIRDMFPPSEAQRMMSQVTIFFGIAPAIAPMIGGVLFVHLGWHSVFWFLAVVGVTLWVANFRLLPETLHVSQRQAFEVANLMRGYLQMGSSQRFWLLALASGIPFNGMFLYVLASPAFLGEHLHLAPDQFYWFFVLTILGITGGAWVSGRLAGKIAPRRQIRHGLLIMMLTGCTNVLCSLLLAPQVWWALPLIALYAFGWALMVPVITLMVLELFPTRRGMASSLQAVVGSVANGIVAGVVAPLVMHSPAGLAIASLLMLQIGLLAWLYLRRRWPETVRVSNFGT